MRFTSQATATLHWRQMKFLTAIIIVAAAFEALFCPAPLILKAYPSVVGENPIRFYVYDDEELLATVEELVMLWQEASHKKCKDQSCKDAVAGVTDTGDLLVTLEKIVQMWQEASLKTCRDQNCDDALSELAVLNALRQHSWRTYNASQADLFIVPIPVAGLMGIVSVLSELRVDREVANMMDAQFEALISHEIFQRHRGNRHVIVSLRPNPFSGPYDRYCTWDRNCRAIQKFYPLLENVTIAQYQDLGSCERIIKNSNVAQFGGYEAFFRTCYPVTTSEFAMGFGAITRGLSLIPVSYDSISKRSLWIFYHTRLRDSFYNSTWFRHAPLYLEPNVTSKLSPSSVGLDVSREEWVRGFQSSKFCLVIRGDDPLSHALVRSIRSGCIPVVISDFFEEYGGPLRSTLTHLDSYAVVIPEEVFQRDPGGALLSLQNLSENEIRQKLDGAAFAQRVLFPDHPQSLFVPSFLKEARRAWSHRRSRSRYSGLVS